MNNEPFKVAVNVYAIFKKDDKYLLQLRSATTGYEENLYHVVAGHVDGNEKIPEALKREIKEEVDLDVKVDDLELKHIVHRKQPDQERIDFFYIVNKWKGKPRIMEKDNCDDLRWYKRDEFPQNITPRIALAIDNISKGVLYGEHGWEDS